MRSDDTDRLGLTLLVAVSVHALVILGISFQFSPPSSAPQPRPSLQITVVHNPQKPEKVEQPERLAQVSQQAGGETAEKTRITTTAPAIPIPRPQQQPRPESVSPSLPSRPRQTAKQVLTRARAPKQVVSAKLQPLPEVKEIRPSAAQILASSSQEIARITSELDRKTAAYSKRPRRRHISASTQEYKYAAYLEAWRKKIERIGNLNYPDEAKRRKLYGNLVLHVAIRADGSVERTEIRTSSGAKVLDDAAVRIVRLSAPFAPFPEEIRKETDILDITRTWQFLNNNRLGWK